MATAVAALKAKASRAIAEHFLSAGALSADEAVSFTPRRLIAERQFARMERVGVIRSTKDGRHWLDLPTYRTWQSRRRLRIAVAGLFGVAIAAALMA